MRVNEVFAIATMDEPQSGNTVERVVKRGRRVQNRHRAGWTAAGATLVVAGVAIVPGLTGSGPGEQSAPQAAAPAAVAVAPTSFVTPKDPFSFTFESFEAGRWKVKDPIVASSAYQIAPVYLDGRITNDKAEPPAGPVDISSGEPAERQETISAYLVLYRPGAFAPDRLKGATKLTVAGRQAWRITSPGAQVDMARKSLAWEYTPGGWAVLESLSNNAADPSDEALLDVVAALKLSPATPATLPFTMGYVPTGYHAVELGSNALAGLNGIASARDGNYGGAIFANPAPAVDGLTGPYGSAGVELPGSFQVLVVPSDNAKQSADGREISCGNGFCSAHRGGKVVVQVDSQGRLSDAEMTRILRGIELTDVRDPGAWIDASIALRTVK